jgi:hypothetical protein
VSDARATRRSSRDVPPSCELAPLSHRDCGRRSADGCHRPQVRRRRRCDGPHAPPPLPYPRPGQSDAQADPVRPGGDDLLLPELLRRARSRAPQPRQPLRRGGRRRPGRIRSATASAKKVNTVWVYPRCRVATRRGVDLRRRQFDRAVTQRVGEQAAVCEEWGGEGEEGDSCMGSRWSTTAP